MTRELPVRRLRPEQLEERTLLTVVTSLGSDEFVDVSWADQSAAQDKLEFSRGVSLPADVALPQPVVEGVVTSYYELSYPGTRANPEASARAFLAAASGQLGMVADTSDLALIEVKQGLGSSHTRFNQTVDGRPIDGAFVSVHQGPDGYVQTLHTQYLPNLQWTAIANPIPLETAVQAAMEADEVTVLRGPVKGELVWYSPDGQTAIEAWRVRIPAAEPLGDFQTLVDAETGQVLSQENRISFLRGMGDAFVPNPYQSQGSGTGLTDNGDADSAALAAQTLPVHLEGLNGTGLLVGEFVNLASLNSSDIADVDANEALHIYEYTRDDWRFEQVVIYAAIDSIQRYIHALGFDDDTGIANGIRDFPTLANAHWDNDDQSFYSTADDAVHFGDGGVDDGEDADIVAHEYGHAIQFNQNSNWGGGQMGAMGEGFGDYLAASFYADIGRRSFQTSHAACVGEWDATSYSGSTPPCLRRVDGNKVYPADLVGQVHADGEIWSRALWDIRRSLGGPVTDQLVLEHHFALPANSTMPTAAQGILTADANLNGGANANVIRTAFVTRGILAAQSTPTAAAMASSVYAAGPTSHGVTVTYVDNTAVDVSDLDSADIRILGPGGFNQLATFSSVNLGTDGTPRIAQYVFTPPGGSWNEADNGTYTIEMVAGEVTDTSNNPVPAGLLGRFQVEIREAPEATAIAADINAFGGTTQKIKVLYEDNVAVDVSDLDSADILVTGPNGFSQIATFSGVNVNTDASPRVATYTITAPGGNWDAADEGVYVIEILAGEVTDTSNNAVPAGAIGTFEVLLGGGGGGGGIVCTTADAFGYQACSVAPTFEDISGTGTQVLPSLDDATLELTDGDLGDFQFNFYGTTYSNLFVSTNGLLTFGTPNSDYSNTDFTTSPTQAAIAPLWDDLITRTSGIYWQVLGSGANERLVVQWHNADFLGSFGGITFQAVLSEADQSIQFNYLDLAGGSVFEDEGLSATVGIKAAGIPGWNRLVASLNNGPNLYVGTGLSTRIAAPLCTVADAFGYQACGIVQPEFEDISGTGTQVLTFVDDQTVELTDAALGDFQFDFYGTTYSNLFVSSNGLLTFASANNAYINTDFSTFPTQAAIAPLWDDLVTNSDGVYWEVRGAGADQRLIVQWHNADFIGSSGSITFQAVLREIDQSIQFNYLDLAGGDAFQDEGLSATVGIKAAGNQGLNRVVASLDQGPNAFVGTGRSVKIAAPTCNFPDASGYQACTVLDASFQDISLTGTAVLADEDDATIELTDADLGDFVFPFYGTTYPNLFVSSNGLITFGSGYAGFTNSDLSAVPAQAAIAPFWDDLVTFGTADAVYWQVLGTGNRQQLVIQWNAVDYIVAEGKITFQAVLNEVDGSIQFNYLDLAGGAGARDEGGSATVGVKAPGAQGVHRLVAAFDNGPNLFVGSGKSTRIIAPSCTAADTWGYQACSLVETQFEDISTTGAAILSNVDDATFELTDAALGDFEFPFYDTTYSNLFVSSNGLLTFGAANGTFTNTDLTSSPAQATIAAFWDDLFVESTENVYWEVRGAGADQRLIVQWHNVEFLGSNGKLTFQAVLREADGSIQFNYFDLDGDSAFQDEGLSATVGIKNTGTGHSQVVLASFNDGPNAFVGSGRSTRIQAPVCTGSDGFGYQACTIVEPQFEDISVTGAAVLANVDDAAVELTDAALGDFQFDFYGTTYSNLFVSSNGLLTFGSANTEYVNQDLTSAPTQAAIAPLWDDLYISPTDEVYWEVRGSGTDQRLIVQWHNIEYYSGFGRIHFQAILSESDNSIQFNYWDLMGDTEFQDEAVSATVGIKDAGTQGANRLLVSYNEGPNAFVGSRRSTRIAVAESDAGPEIVTLSPADGATNVALGADLAITFNENVQKGTGNILIKRTSDDAVVQTIDVTSGAVTISGAVATINPPADLAESTGYYVQVAAGAFEDLAGNDFAGINDTTTWNFVSVGIAPVISTLSPADGATDVAIGVDLAITFNENVQKGTGNILIKRTSDDAVVQTIDVTSGAVTISGAVATINPPADLAESTGYYVQVSAGAFEDLAGNDFAGINDTTTWNFVTAAPASTIIDVRLVVLDVPTQNNATALPNSNVNAVDVGDSYYVEIWVSNIGVADQGIAGGRVDVNYSTATADATQVFNNDFTLLPSGTINDPAGLVDDVGGGTLDTNRGLAPAWSRLAYFQVTAAAPGVADYDLAEGNLQFALTGSGNVAWNSVDLTSTAAVTHQALEILVLPVQAATTANSTSLPTPISNAVVGSNYFVEIWVQNFGVSGQGIVGGRVDVNYTTTTVDAVQVYNNDFTLLGNGTINDGLGLVDDLGGATLDQNRGLAPAWARLAYIEVTATAQGAADYGLAAGNLQFALSGGNNVPWESIDLSATASVQHAPGAQIDLTVVTTPTSTDANGEVTSLPSNEAWVDEWETWYVEVWVSTPSSSSFDVSAAMLDLGYATARTSAEQITYGPAFTQNQTGTINDGSGVVSGLGAASPLADLGDDKFVLLARVRFGDAGSGDDAGVDEANRFAGPYSLGLSASNRQVNLGMGLSSAEGGPVPTTEMWPVIYDVNDSDVIDFADFAAFSQSFGLPVGGTSPPTWWADFNKTGSVVDFADFAAFSQNFGRSSAGGQAITFPGTYPDAWRPSGKQGGGNGLAQKGNIPSLPMNGLVDPQVPASPLDGLSASDPRDGKSFKVNELVCRPGEASKLPASSGAAHDALFASGEWLTTDEQDERKARTKKVDLSKTIDFLLESA